MTSLLGTLLYIQLYVNSIAQIIQGWEAFLGMGCLVDCHCHFCHHQHHHQCHHPLFSYNVSREPTPHCKLRIHSLFTILVSMVSERKETFFLVRNHPPTLKSLFSFIHSSSSLGLSLLSWYWLLEVAWLHWGTASGWENKWKRWAYK